MGAGAHSRADNAAGFTTGYRYIHSSVNAQVVSRNKSKTDVIFWLILPRIHIINFVQ